LANAEVKPTGDEPGLLSTAPDSSVVRGLISYLSGMIALIALGWAGELPYRLGFALYNEQVLAAIVGLSLALVFLGVSVRRHKGVVPWYDWLAAALGLGAGVYTAIPDHGKIGGRGLFKVIGLHGKQAQRVRTRSSR